jgi:hypothetical protein
MANRSAGTQPVVPCTRPFTRSASHTAARRLSSVIDDGGPKTQGSSKNEASRPKKGRSILPLRLASRAWHALISTP